MAETILAKMAVQIAANTSQFNAALTKSDRNFSKFAGSVTKIAGTLGVAFGIQQITSFGFEIAKLAGEAEGVKAAFDRLPESTKLMNELKTATGGTVSELELMKKSVQAANFGIELKALPDLLKFATLRAQQTGESVDYLVNSIITGIGRKSPLILDNLGISAVRLKEQFNGASLEAQNIGDVAKAVGRIASEELEKMGDFAENSATKIARLSASWDNLKVAIGNVANSGGIINKTLNNFTNALNAISGDAFTVGFNKLIAGGRNASETLERLSATGEKIDVSWQELLARGFVQTEAAARKYEKVLADIQKRTEDLGIASKAVSAEIDAATGLPASGGTPWVKPEVVKEQVVTLDSLKAKVKELNDQFESTDSVDKAKLANIGKEILQTKALIDELEKLRKEQEKIIALGKLSTFGKEQLGDAEAGKKTILGGPQFEQVAAPKLGDIFNQENAIALPALDTSALFSSLDALDERYTLTQVKQSDSIEQMIARHDALISKQQQVADSAVQFGDAIGNALGSALSGQQSFADAMKRLTADLLKTFLARALGGIIASAATSGGPPPVAIALAAAGVAAISAMFSKIGGQSKSVSSSLGRGGSSQSSNFERQVSGEQVVLVGGEIKFKGNALVLAFDKANKEKQRTG